MKKIVFLLFAAVLSFSCKDDTVEDTKPVDISGNWKISHYEFRGKNYDVKGCDTDDRIIIQKDLQGSYKNSGIINNVCDYIENISGTWNFDYLAGKLTLKYQDNNTEKSKIINLNEYSNTNLKIQVNDKNIDGVEGNDDAIEVWLKY